MSMRVTGLVCEVCVCVCVCVCLLVCAGGKWAQQAIICLALHL